MQALASNAKLCEVCLRLDIHRLTQPLHPCRNPLPCLSLPHDFGLALGSVAEIKGRRLACDICRLVAESLDKEPLDLDGECHITKSEYCSFKKLPKGVTVQDPSVTHFHLIQASVVFSPSEWRQYHDTPLPWESKERSARSARSARSILDLQARASSYTGQKDTAAASPQTEHDFLATIGGRYVSKQADTQLIRTWLHQCEREHGKRCIHSLGPSAGGEPTFVIDVVESCLVDTPTQCRYAALSYVWGTIPVFIHLMKDTQDLRKAGSLRSLPIPATIQDAITLVYAIGERYLWVDSICIVQDDWKMKMTEITRMGMVYSGALFTIIAAAGDHANAGLPGIGTRDRVQKILRIASHELLTVIDNAPRGINNTTWAQRAWTFQERILSNRVLVFSESQVYWSCRMVSHSEERALEEVRDVHLFRFPFPYQAYTDLWELESLREPSKYATLYYTLLSAYRQRRMTYKTDVLNAFDGVSETLATIRNDTFFWGLPESFFSCALSWRLTGHYAREKVEVPILDSNGSPVMIPIPSWSWAAWWTTDLTRLPRLLVETTDIRPVICFDIVDSKCQLVRIREQSWPDCQALWKGERSDQVKCDTKCPPLRPGQLCFWTSFGNTKAVREQWDSSGPWTAYRMLPYPGYQPLDSSAEVVDQDFIVIAVGLFKKLILLAIEWEDGVAYRVGRTEATEAKWLAVENRQWRLITLG